MGKEKVQKLTDQYVKVIDQLTKEKEIQKHMKARNTYDEKND